MPNYNNSYIYKLCCKNPEIKDFYIGSTTNFKNRKNQHKSETKANRKKGQNNLYKCIRENGGFQNWDMILIENINVNSKLELHKKEREYIEKLKPTLNHYPPTATEEQKRERKNEFMKEYTLKNKEKINEYQIEYRKKNMKKMLEKQREKITCECGCILARGNIAEHRRTKKHLKFMKLKENSS